MLDNTIPHHTLVMYKTDTQDYPQYSLPEGYEFVFYRPGDEAAWADIECSVGQFSAPERALACFRRDFVDGYDLDLGARMLFVKDPYGEYVATASLWDGEYLGEPCQHFHWLAVKDSYAGKGIAKALLTRLMKLYGDLGYEGFVYLVTGTRSYPAVRLYRRFGFREYMGPRTLLPGMTDEQFVAEAETAVAIINEKLSAWA